MLIMTASLLVHCSTLAARCFTPNEGRISPNVLFFPFREVTRRPLQKPVSNGELAPYQAAVPPYVLKFEKPNRKTLTPKARIRPLLEQPVIFTKKASWESLEAFFVKESTNFERWSFLFLPLIVRHSDIDRGEAHITRLVLSFKSYRVHSLLPSPTSLSSDKYSSVRSYLEVGSSIP